MTSFREIILGLGSGYLQKLIQIGANIIIVPLMISDRALGLSEYGELMTILTVVAFFSMILDGARLSISRKVGQQRGADNSGLGVSVAAMLLVLFIPIILLAFFGEYLFSFAGLDQIGSSIILLSIILLFFEQLNYVLAQHYHSAGLTWQVNFLTTVLVILRFVVICLAVFFLQFSIEIYLVIFSTFFLVQWIYFVFDLCKRRVLVGGDLSFETEELREVLHYSWPLSLKGLATFFVYRFGVIVCNRVIGPDAAAVYSLIFTTIKNYLGQIFVAVLRPMVIPITAAKDIANISQKNIQLLRSLLRIYDLFVVGAVFFVAFSADFWLELWLGDIFLEFSILFSLAIMIIALEVVSGIKALLLISQGFGKSLSLYSMLFAAVLIASLFYIMSTKEYASIEVVIYLTLFYIVAYNGMVVMRLFQKNLGAIDTGSYILRLIVYACSGGAYFYAHSFSVGAALAIGFSIYCLLTALIFKGVASDLQHVTGLIFRGKSGF